MHLQKLQLGLLLTLFAGFLWSCNQEKTSQTNVSQISEIPINQSPKAADKPYVVQPPLSKVDVAFQTFEMRPNEAKTIELANGTTIEIPADAFVDANGNPVTQDVEIRYREFHDAAAVLSSGIPMKVRQPDGQEAYMQTAGMFEINAYVAELPLQLAENKQIMVNMASNVDGSYDFWNYDVKAGQWVNAGVNEPAINPKKEAAKVALAKMEKELKSKNTTAPVMPAKFDKSKPVLNFDVNYNVFPELQQMKGIVWQYSGNDSKMNPLSTALQVSCGPRKGR